MEAIISLLEMPIVGVLFGGFLAILGSRIQASNDKYIYKSRRQLEKLEQIYILLNEIEILYREFYIDTKNVVLFKKEPKTGEKIIIPFSELSMNINFYASELNGDLDEFIRLAQGEIGGLFVEAKIFTPESELDRKLLQEKINIKYRELSDNIGTLKEKVTALSKRYF